MEDWARALFGAWVSTYLGGGISPISSYLGLKPPDRALLYEKYEGLISYWNYILTAMRTFPDYFILFLVGTAFSLIGRFTGVIGLITSINKRSLLPYHFFYISPIFIFTATYLFIGVSRFRAHLEPILAIYAAIGITACISLICKFLSRRSA